MTGQAIRIYQGPQAQPRRRGQSRRVYVVLNTLGEAVATLSIGICFILCSVLLLCVI